MKRRFDEKKPATVGNQAARSLRFGHRLRYVSTLTEVQPLNGGAFLIVIPSFDQKKRKRATLVVIASTQMQSVIECLSAPALHVTIQTPFRGGIIEARPCGPNGNLAGMLVGYVLVKIVQIFLAPITAVRLPSLPPGLNPGVEAGKI